MNNKEKLKSIIQQGSNTTATSTFYNPGYDCNPYFGASSFYGEQSRLYEPRYDMIKKEHTWFIPRQFKAIGRQLMK